MCVCAPPLKFENDVQGVDDTLNGSLVRYHDALATGGTHRNVTKDGQQNVDEEISIAAALKEDT